MESVTVECYSGYKGEERPQAFVWKGKRFTIVEIERRWYQQGIKAGSQTKAFFKVKAEDKRTYLICQDQGSGEWSLEGSSGVSSSDSDLFRESSS